METPGQVNTLDLCKATWATEALPVSALQGAREFKHTVIEGFTDKGGVAVARSRRALTVVVRRYGKNECAVSVLSLLCAYGQAAVCAWRGRIFCF